MKPDEKYMKNKTTTSDDDLNLVPFKGGGAPFTMTPSGWIPVYFFGNSAFDNNIASSMGLPSPTNSKMMQSNMNNKNMQGNSNMQGYNNTSKYNTSNNMQNSSNMQSSNTSQNPNTIQDYNNPNTFPDESNGENLYSYNTSNSSNTNFNANNPTVASTNRSTPNILNILRDLNIDLDEDNDLVRHCADKRIDKIYEKIEKNNPEIMGVLETYEMPCPIAKVLIRKIIKLTLNHCKRDGD